MSGWCDCCGEWFAGGVVQFEDEAVEIVVTVCAECVEAWAVVP